jgi:hypothetical protein
MPGEPANPKIFRIFSRVWGNLRASTSAFRNPDAERRFLLDFAVRAVRQYGGDRISPSATG